MLRKRVVDPFDSLTRSALDFVTQAAKQLKSAPKFAVINLATAIELFLKARLVREHWSLVVSRPDKASQTAFQNGSFQSVGLDDAIDRLRNVAGEALARHEEACFRELRDHRNKLVHFYHETYLDRPDAASLASIAAEQCRAWFLLKRLLESRWRDAFRPYSKEIGRVQKLIAKNREYLQGKYLALREEIEAEIKSGVDYETCAACGQYSSQRTRHIDPLIGSACAVCERRHDYIEVACPNCATLVRVEELGEGECQSCGYKTTLAWLIDKYGPYEDPKEDPETGFCGHCENFDVRSVVPLGDTFVCLSCLGEHSGIGRCGWCAEFVAGDLESSYLSGCFMCDGRLGWDSD